MFREIFGPKSDEAVNLEYYLTKVCFVGSDRAGHQKVEFLECYVLIRLDTEQVKFHNTFLHFSRYSSVERSY